MKFNLKAGLFTSLGLLTVFRCPCCGSPLCSNSIPPIVGAFLIGGLLGGKKESESETKEVSQVKGKD